MRLQTFLRSLVPPSSGWVSHAWGNQSEKYEPFNQGTTSARPTGKVVRIGQGEGSQQEERAYHCPAKKEMDMQDRLKKSMLIRAPRGTAGVSPDLWKWGWMWWGYGRKYTGRKWKNNIRLETENELAGGQWAVWPSGQVKTGNAATDASYVLWEWMRGFHDWLKWRSSSLFLICSLLTVLMMEAVRTSDTFVNSYQSTQCYNPEDKHLCTHCRENPKS
jgi:hypothetical protein